MAHHSISFPFKRVLVTGGNGFLGRHVTRALQRAGAEAFPVCRSDYDLLHLGQTWSLFNDAGISSDSENLRCDVDLVIHCAARVGGIGYNQANPAAFLHDNAMMGLNILEACRKGGVKKVILIGTTCSYPKDAPLPLRESSLWDGYPEPTNAPYGLAKRLVMEAGIAYHRQYGLNVVNLVLANLYGPGDCFDPARSHVIPAVIRKVTDAYREDKPDVELWGTGKPTRDFLYVEDAAKAILRAAEMIDNDPQPVNIGTGCETGIGVVAELAAIHFGWHGEFHYDCTRPDGQPRRVLDTTRAKELMGWQAEVNIVDGLSRMIDWYLANQPAAVTP